MQNNFYPLVVRGFLSSILGTLGIFLNLRTNLVALYIIYQLSHVAPIISTAFFVQNGIALLLGLILYRFLQSVLASFLTYFSIKFEINHFIQNLIEVKSPTFLLISGLVFTSLGINLLTFSGFILTHLTMLNLPVIYTLSAAFISFGVDRIISGIDLQLISFKTNFQMSSLKIPKGRYQLILKDGVYSAYHNGNELKIPFSDLFPHRHHSESMVRWLFINADINHEKSNIGPFLRNTLIVGCALFSFQIAVIALVSCNIINHLFTQYSQLETDKAFIRNKQDLYSLQAILTHDPLYQCASTFNLITRTWLYMVSSPISLRLHYLDQYAKQYITDKNELDQFKSSNNAKMVQSLFDYPLLNLMRYFAVGLLHISKKIAYAPCGLFYQKAMPIPKRSAPTADDSLRQHRQPLI